MPAPNYGFEKRKRELAKKAAKEAKRLRKDSKPAAPETPDSAPSERPADSTKDAASGESIVSK